MPDIKIDKIRFRIADEQNRVRSALWFAFNLKNDVYIGTRTLGGQCKLSLHRDGNCQFGLTRGYLDGLAQAGIETTHKPARWTRAVTPSVGATHVASIVFPTDYLHGEMPPGGKKLLFEFLPAPAGHAVEIGFFYSRERPETLEHKFIAQATKPMFYMSLPSGEFTSMVGRIVPFLLIPDLKHWSRTAQPLDGAPKPGDQMCNASAILWNAPQNGRAIRLVDVSGLTVFRSR